MAVGQRLKIEREKRGWSIGQLATRSGVSKGAISKIEREQRKPQAETLQKVASALGLSMNALMPEAEPVALPRSQSFGGFAAVPMVRAAHAGKTVVLQESGPPRYLTATAEDVSSWLAAEVQGDCLEPEICSGDLVFFDTQRRTLNHNDVVVVTSADGDLMVRRVVRLPDGSLWLTDRHNTMEQPDGIRLEGVVMISQRKHGRPL